MDEFAALEAQYKKLCQIYDFIDLRILNMEDGLFKCEVPLNEKTANHINIIHASVLFAIGEVLGGMVHNKYVADPARFQPVVRDLKIDFKAPAMTDVTAEAVFAPSAALEMNTQLEATGRYDYALAAKLTDTQGHVVAETLGNYAIRDFRKKA